MALDVQRYINYKNKVIDNCKKAIVGKDDVLQLVLTCFICRGHVLLEDVPGTGKTMLLRAFSKTIGGAFKRVQFTPDLLPSDLTGINFYSQKTGEFEFRPGPLFTNIMLADEINRATPRTQSSLLEAMEEKQITVDGVTYRLAEPFMVMATQNPLESYGTFPLPEAQIDRFFMRLSLGYMTREQEINVISRPSTLAIIDMLKTCVAPEETEYVRNAYTAVRVQEDVRAYIMDIVEKTREDKRFTVGVSTRGAIALYKAAQVTALFSGRDYVMPEDVRFVAPHVLCHRLSSGGTMRASEVLDYFNELIRSIPVPLENQ